MDERLSHALETSKLMFVINQQKRIITEQYRADLVYYSSGCQFSASQELISFCNSMLQLEQTQSVILDDNNIPLLVEDLAEFTNMLVQTYANASNTYYKKYEDLKKQRSVNGILS